ncbi:hypothetical protein M422DRAFT_268370 [Sphaerobolus stellatus SS14]|uniref:Uncharacterized protein n=1 Tax=Sphaerobolus stellatus (strain SS14) TaxID=990650 RepID=A0A0C9UMR4_SPHS4|nr:hypothetical protein M422DRAFT_268370 [Sphaerobolus stellatus SS14]
MIILFAAYLLIPSLLLTSAINGLFMWNIHKALARRNSISDYTTPPLVYPMPETWNTQEVALSFQNDVSPITSDEDWAALFPPNQGKVRLDAFPRQEFIIGMYQQLHCLDIVRVAFLQLHATPSQTKVANFTESDHCIEQLFQTILCHADVTLEPAMLVDDGGGELVPATGGIGVDHRCRDWSEIRNQVK